MPRLSFALLWKAYRVSPCLPLLLRACRTLPSAQNELRWLEAYVRGDIKALANSDGTRMLKASLLHRLCQLRSKGVPLQYLLGSQPFGDLDILCAPEVLIPRPETEESIIFLADKITRGHLGRSFEQASQFKILDLCSGSGCISLLLHSLLSEHFPALKIEGIDITAKAISLSNRSLRYNIREGKLNASAASQISFHGHDLFARPTDTGCLGTSTSPTSSSDDLSYVNVVVSNPPYISASGFWRSTSSSVRKWEPKIALVPQSTDDTGEENDMKIRQEDIFYPRILEIASDNKAQIVLMEVGDLLQATRVAGMAIDADEWDNVEIWRDVLQDYKSDQESSEHTIIEVGGRKVEIKGRGNGRSVVCWRG